MKRKLVQIQWQDARLGNNNWQSMDDLKWPIQPYIVESVGFIIREDNDILHIASNIQKPLGGGHYYGDIQIPKKMIIKMKELK